MLKILITVKDQEINNALALLTNQDMLKDYGIYDLSIDSNFIHAYSTYTDANDLEDLLTQYINQTVFVTYSSVPPIYFKH